MKRVYGFLILVLLGCSEDFLDTAPKGELSDNVILSSQDGVEGLLISAYSVLNGQVGNSNDAYNSPASNWSFGDVVSDDAYKGSSGVSDQPGIHNMETFNGDPNVRDLQRKWAILFEGIVRANAAIRAINAFEGYDEDERAQRLAEARFLRGHYYFDLKKIYNNIPYFREDATSTALRSITNTEFSSDQIWDFIEEDFREAAKILPDLQTQAGRVTKGAANAYLAKAHLYQGEWMEASTVADLVISSTAGYDLLPNFSDVFHPDFNNSVESVFAIQHSINDGADRNGFNGNVGDRLSMVGGPYPRLYGFHMPSQNLANFFKTDASGLPLLTTFNNSDLGTSDNIDPRLDHTIGRNGIPFLDAGVFRNTWVRGNSTYGNFGKKKGHVPVNSEATYLITTNPYTNTLNFQIIRFADVLLMKAEALVELGASEGARTIVNRIRRRAKNGLAVMNETGTAPAASYMIEEYTNTWADPDDARDAVRAERRLELAMEGSRFFDLVRWGIAEEVMNTYISNEMDLRSYLVTASFQAGKHEYFPIPQSEIDISEGRINQNSGY